MPTTTTFLTFSLAAFILLITPGPAIMYLVGRSIDQGVRAGLISVLGLSTGVLFHVAAAAAGLSALLLASATAFMVVKSLGAAYLIYLGIRTLMGRPRNSDPSAPRASRRLFLDGVVVNILNPKLALFFLAFLPQFVDPSRGSVPRQIVILGLLYIAIALITDSSYAIAAGRLRRLMPVSNSPSPWTRYFAGTVYLGMGLTAALTGRRN